MWLLFAFLAPAFYAIAEIFDNFLVNRKFSKHPLTLAFYSALFNLIFIPILFYIETPVMPPLDTLPIFLVLGLVAVGYLYPYYRGLQTDDTSVAISFFAIGRVFIPVIAFLVVGEVLEISQYVGIALVMVSTIALGLHHSRQKFKFSKAVWFIGCAAFILAFEGVLLKLLFERGVTVSTAIGGESLMALVISIFFLLIPKVRQDITKSLPLFIKLSPIFLVEELFTFLGFASEGRAISATSVSVVKGITMASPFFLLIYAWIGRSFFPFFFKEDLHKKNVLKKLFLFLVLIIGIILIKD